MYDEALSFSKQAERIKEKIAARRGITARLAGTTWGQDTSTLRALHLAYVQSRLDYGLAAWGPFLNDTAINKLQPEQYQAACTISGCARGTRVAAALAEAHLTSVEQRIDYAAASMHERCVRLPQGNAARAVAERDDPPDPTRGRTWRRRARRVAAAADLPNGEREPIATHSRAAPWERAGDVDFHVHLCRKVSKKKNTPEQLREAALETLARLPKAAVEGFTDGSVINPCRLGKGGGGYTLTDAAGAEHKGRCAAGARCTSYVAELRAMKKMLTDLADPASGIAVPRGAEIRIGLDSQAAIRALER
eukprot:gene14669-biopygen23311